MGGRGRIEREEREGERQRVSGSEEGVLKGKRIERGETGKERDEEVGWCEEGELKGERKKRRETGRGWEGGGKIESGERVKERDRE